MSKLPEGSARELELLQGALKFELAENQRLVRIVETLADTIYRLVNETGSFTITQGDNRMITGIERGTSAHFTATPQPPGSIVTGTPTWVSDDPAVSLTPSGDGLSVSAAVPDSGVANGQDFGLTITAPKGESATVRVPVLPPAAAEATGFAVDEA